MKPIFITGIGTDVGKTIFSAVITEKLKANYWKPIQCGSLEFTDSMQVAKLLTNSQSIIYPEAYLLKGPYSPHKAAALENISIDIHAIQLPKTNNQLIVEGAGGLMVPINKDYLIIDLIKKFNAEVILVAKNYLGSINHTLLSIEVLKFHNIPVKGIVFSGESDTSSEEIKLHFSGLNCLGTIPHLSTLNPTNIKEAGKQITI